MSETSIKINAYPRMIQEFAAQNFNLKILCAALITLLFFMLLLVLFLAKSGPMVIALEGSGKVARVETKVTDLQIQAAVEEYLSYRYNWTEKSVEQQLKRAEFFVLPGLVSAFQKSMLNVQKYVREKKVTQRIYPKRIAVDLKERKISILADRITEFESLKAATEMTLNLDFLIESRSVINPWGVYITKEREGAGK